MTAPGLLSPVEDERARLVAWVSLVALPAAGLVLLLAGPTRMCAARLESRAPADGVVVGGPTLRAVRGLRVTALGPLGMNGKQEPVEAYRLEMGG
ncbi:MAG: hypothetical protein H0T69_13515 [Thermoleophilaceae bacterium]|nr:hypothetical protein [Thermoleophilaceae bacterium]